jgi:transcriptional regulator with XRE-family HTH domain
MNGGQKLKQARKAQELSVPKLAEKLGVMQSTIWRIENGGQIPSRDLMLKITEFSGGEITPNDFFSLPQQAAS